MTTETLKPKATGFYASVEDQENLAAVIKMLRGRGHRMNGLGVTEAVSYSLRKVVLSECSTDGSAITDRNAA
jgi:hypothetical protein